MLDTYQERTLLGHPIGLCILFLTEMWERFSFYGMRVLLVLYLTQHFRFTDQEAVLLFGGYVALTGMSPILGGIVADRYIGHRKAVVIGAILLTIGHFCMAFEGDPATMIVSSDDVISIERDPVALQVLYVALALIVVGVGFLKANITALVSFLYTADDPRRDSGFTLFQMGISSGAMAAAVLCGYLGQTYGWRYGFGVAGIGMVAGLFVFLLGQKYIVSPADHTTRGSVQLFTSATLKRDTRVYASAILAVLIVFVLLKSPSVIGVVLGTMSLATVVGTIFYIRFKCDRTQREKFSIAIAYLLMIIVFFVLIEQAGTSLVLFADRNVDLNLFGIQMKSSQTFAFLPGSLILFAPIIAWIWPVLARRNMNPSASVKCGIGMTLTALGFVALTSGASTATSGMVPVEWLVLTFLLFALGDLFIAPVALSVVTALGGARLAGLMVGLYLLAVAAGSYVAALFARMAVPGQLVIERWPAQVSLENFVDLFTILAAGGVMFGVIIFLVSPILRRRTHGLR